MIVDLINKKRLGKELSYKELDDFFNGYLDGKIKDYQMPYEHQLIFVLQK